MYPPHNPFCQDDEDDENGVKVKEAHFLSYRHLTAHEAIDTTSVRNNTLLVKVVS